MKKFLTAACISLTFATVLLSSFTTRQQAANQLTEQEKKEGWTLLFDGKTTNGWHLYNKGKVKSAWTVKNGELLCQPDVFNVEHGDLVSDKEFENYDLKFEWKISKEGNSGVFINVLEKSDIPTAWASGPEYQLLDISHPDYNANLAKRAGCIFGFAPQKNPAVTQPAGQWNESRIVQVNGKIDFYLNGVHTAEMDLTSDGWKETVAKSGFQYFPEFGKHTKGKIGLQDWSKGISFKNVKIKTL